MRLTIKKLDDERGIIEKDNYFIVNEIYGDYFSIFFNKPKTVNYINLKKKQNLVFSTHQIDDFMKDNSIQDLEFQLDCSTICYSKEKFALRSITDDELNFKAIILVNKNFEPNSELLEQNELSPLKLSIYFYEYFEYNDENETNFIYYDTPERKKLMNYLEDFYFSQYNYFKFCGPISGGKSTTLLKFRNEYEGIVYFNLKSIKKHYLNGNINYKSIMIYELNKIKVKEKKKEDVLKELSDIISQNDVLEIIFMKIIEYLLKIKVRNIIIIDQFKETHFDHTTFIDVEKTIKNTHLGLILSSSIDEKGIKDELIITLKKFNKIPNKIIMENQIYYFYVPDLLKNEIVKEKLISQKIIDNDFIDLYEHFSFKTKYISFLKNKENLDTGINNINKQITAKMMKNSHFPSSEFIFMFINDNIGIKLKYTEENINKIRNMPLKFIDIHFNDDHFSFDYGFPYIKTLVENGKKNININKYFEQKMYDVEFYSLFKGIYFENLVNLSIFDKKISFDNCFNNNNKIFKLIVNNVIDMDENDKNNTVYTIINRIKNNDLNNSYTKKNYKDYIKDRIEAINREIGASREKQLVPLDINNNLIQALEEELKILSEDEKKYSDIKNGKKPNKYGDKIIISYDDDFKGGNILIEQTQTNARCLDSAFLFGDKDKKTLVCLQMKFYNKETSLSSDDKGKLNKPYIKKTCKKVLSNIYLNLGIKIKKWHYVMILYYEYKSKTFNTNFVKVCNENDLEYIFFDPLEKKFYSKYYKEIKNLSLFFFSDLDCDEIESNTLMCFEESKEANIYLQKRNREIKTPKDSPKALAKSIAKKFEEQYKVSFQKFFEQIKKQYNFIKNIEIILSLKMVVDQYIPTLKEGYGLIFLNDPKNELIFKGKTKKDGKYIIFYKENDMKIPPLKLFSLINIEEEFIFFVVKITLNFKKYTKTFDN